jgi:hypothetical protein
MVLRIFLRPAGHCAKPAGPQPQCVAQLDKTALHIGAAAFIHRFGSSLNEHVHFHVSVVDGEFEVAADDEKFKLKQWLLDCR